MTVFFTSDTHFGHKNIISFCKRPFTSVIDMNKCMIDRWNRLVTENDDVFHLGDVSFSSHVDEHISQLRGRLHLIHGNHDNRTMKNNSRWTSSNQYLEFKLDNTRINLFHYPMRAWNGDYHGSLMLHGHTHNTLPPIKNSLDVGVDAWDYTPVTLDQILKRLS